MCAAIGLFFYTIAFVSRLCPVTANGFFVLDFEWIPFVWYDF